MGKIKVLFIDDDIALGNVVTVALDSLGYETYYQTSLVAIRSVIKELCPDILILDVEIGQKEWYRSYTRIEAYLTGYTHPFRIVAYRKLFCDAGIGCRRDRISEETFRD